MNVFAYRMKHALGFKRDEQVLFFFVEGSDDQSPPVVILPPETSRETAEQVLAVLGHTLTEWEEIA